MIQEIFPLVFSNAYVPREPLDRDYIIFYKDGDVLMKVGTGCAKFKRAVGSHDQDNPDNPDDDAFLRIPRVAEINGLIGNVHTVLEHSRYLFSVDDIAFFYFGNGFNFPGIENALVRRKQEVFRRISEKWQAFAGITACHLASWYERHRICGKCGEATRHSDNQRMLECSMCGTQVFPTIAPAVIVGVVDGDSLLLTRYADRPIKNFALVAGFAEIGETIEDTVHREVMEEVGLRVKNLRFYKSQPWGFSGSLLMGFFCDLDGDNTITLDTVELAAAEWHTRDTIPQPDTIISLTGEMINHFMNRS